MLQKKILSGRFFGIFYFHVGIVDYDIRILPVLSSGAPVLFALKDRMWTKNSDIEVSSTDSFIV